MAHKDALTRQYGPNEKITFWWNGEKHSMTQEKMDQFIEDNPQQESLNEKQLRDALKAQDKRIKELETKLNKK